MIFIAIMLIAGLAKANHSIYWKRAFWAVLLNGLAGILFAGGGTLQDPTGDGIITAMIRSASNDGPQVLFAAIGVLFLAYVIPIWLLVTGYRKSQPFTSEEDYKPNWKALWLWLTVIVSVTMVALRVWEAYERFLAPKLGRTHKTADKGEDIAQAVLSASINLNKELPKRIDKITVLEKTSAFERQFSYHYSLEIDASQRDAAISYTRGNVPKRACGGKDNRAMMRDYGVVYIYRYQTPNDPSPFEVRVDEQRCRELGL